MTVSDHSISVEDLGGGLKAVKIDVASYAKSPEEFRENLLALGLPAEVIEKAISAATASTTDPEIEKVESLALAIKAAMKPLLSDAGKPIVKPGHLNAALCILLGDFLGACCAPATMEETIEACMGTIRSYATASMRERNDGVGAAMSSMAKSIEAIRERNGGTLPDHIERLWGAIKETSSKVGVAPVAEDTPPETEFEEVEDTAELEPEFQPVPEAPARVDFATGASYEGLCQTLYSGNFISAGDTLRLRRKGLITSDGGLSPEGLNLIGK